MSDLLAARAQMGTSLAFHIIFASLGVGLSLLLCIAEGLALWHKDATWMTLTRRWTKAFALLFAIGAAIGLGFVVGPALGGLLAPLGPTIPFWAAMMVALANALLVLRFLPETRIIESIEIEIAGRGQAPARFNGMGVIFAGWRQVLRHPVVA